MSRTAREDRTKHEAGPEPTAEELFGQDSDDDNDGSLSFPQVAAVADFGGNDDTTKKKKKKSSGGFQTMGETHTPSLSLSRTSLEGHRAVQPKRKEGRRDRC